MENTDPNHAYPNQAEETAVSDAAAELEGLTRQLGECEARLAEMRDTVLRERADVDNQRKRMQRELEQARRFANEKLLADLLPVLDNLERGLSAEAADPAALRSGIDLTLRELIRVTGAIGLKSVGQVGEPFDPDRHQAMNVVDNADHRSEHVAAVMQKGYVLNDRLLRPALVSVAK